MGDHKLENNNTKQVLPLLWRFWTPRQGSQPGDLTKGLGIPRESDLEGQWDLITGLSQDWGETETPVLEGTNKIVHTPRPRGEEQWPTGEWTKTTCECWRVSRGGGGLAGAHCRDRVTGSSSPGRPPWEVTSNPTIDPQTPGLHCLRPNCNPRHQKITGLKLYWADTFLTKRGPLEKGTANYFSILDLRTPWTVW